MHASILRARRGARLFFFLAALALPAALRAQTEIVPPAEPPVLRAVRAGGAVMLDGRLDEADWARAPVARGFRQINPEQGEPARLDTEVRVLFDDEHLYVAAFNRDSMGLDGLRVPDLRRDFSFNTHDQFGVTLDPLGDGRYATVFAANPYGAQRDQQVTDGRRWTWSGTACGGCAPSAPTAAGRWRWPSPGPPFGTRRRPSAR